MTGLGYHHLQEEIVMLFANRRGKCGCAGGSRRKLAACRPTSIRCFRPFLECLEDRLAPAAMTFTVDRVGDGLNDGMGNSGTLRYCVNKANLNAGADTLEVKIGNDATAVRAIVLASPVDITDQVTITGFTQAGAAK